MDSEGRAAELRLESEEGSLKEDILDWKIPSLGMSNMELEGVMGDVRRYWASLGRNFPPANARSLKSRVGGMAMETVLPGLVEQVCRERG